MRADTPLQRIRMFVADWNAGRPDTALNTYFAPGYEVRRTPQMARQSYLVDSDCMFPPLDDEDDAFVVEQGPHAWLSLRREAGGQEPGYGAFKLVCVDGDWLLTQAISAHLRQLPRVNLPIERLALDLMTSDDPTGHLGEEHTDVRWEDLGFLHVDDDLLFYDIREGQHETPNSPVPHGRHRLRVLRVDEDKAAAASIVFSKKRVVELQPACTPLGWGHRGLLIAPSSASTEFLRFVAQQHWDVKPAALSSSTGTKTHDAVCFAWCWEGSSHAMWFWGLDADGRTACLFMLFAEPDSIADAMVLPYPLADQAALHPGLVRVDAYCCDGVDVSVDHLVDGSTGLRLNNADGLVVWSDDCGAVVGTEDWDGDSLVFDGDIRDLEPTLIVDVETCGNVGQPLDASCWRTSGCRTDVRVTSGFSVDEVSQLLAGGLGCPKVSHALLALGEVAVVIEETDSGVVARCTAPTPTLSTKFIEAVSEVMHVLADVGCNVVAEGMYVELLPGRGRLMGATFRVPSMSVSGSVW